MHFILFMHIATYILTYVAMNIRAYYVYKYVHITCSYSTAQFKLDRARVQQGHDTTHFSFHTRASLRAHARLMTSSLSCIALVYTLDMCTMHACMSEMHTPNLDYACKQIVSQGQRNKIYKHFYVLRCNPSSYKT